jgi:hypothetical protein
MDVCRLKATSWHIGTSTNNHLELFLSTAYLLPYKKQDQSLLEMERQPSKLLQTTFSAYRLKLEEEQNMFQCWFLTMEGLKMLASRATLYVFQLSESVDSLVKYRASICLISPLEKIFFQSSNFHFQEVKQKTGGLIEAGGSA